MKMIKAEERATQFKKELNALCKKWDAEIEIETILKSHYTEHLIRFVLNGVFNKEGNCIAERAIAVLLR